MKPLIIEDLVNVKIYLTQIMGDYFNCISEILGGNMILVIQGKPGSIPDDIADKVIEELKEFNYVTKKNDKPGIGQVVVVYGRGEK